MVAQVNRSIMHPVQIVQGVSNAPYAYRSLVQWFDCINFVRAIEPACGSGANLIALANVLKEKGINYQRNVYFVGQDIDPLVAKMCYIQMSLLGMPGIVIVGDTLSSPMKGDYWLTPFHFIFGISILQRHKKRQKQEAESQQEESADHDNDWLLELVGISN